MQSRALRTIAVLAAPVGVGVLAAVHPLVDGTLIPADDLAVWTLIHTLQIPLAALLGIAVLLLLDGLRDAEAAVARLAVVPWVAAFAAFDGVAGLATGALSDYGRANPEHAAVALDIGATLAASPVVSALLPLGAFAASLAVFGGAAVALHRAGTPLAGAVALGVGGALWTFVHPLVGAPAMGLFAFGAVLALRSERRTRARSAVGADPTPGLGTPLMES
jgi:hypothetical protein